MRKLRTAWFPDDLDEPVKTSQQLMAESALRENWPEVLNLMQSRVDPNLVTVNFLHNGKQISTGSVLPLAVMRSEPSTLQTLVEKRADVSAKFSFKTAAGHWSGPAIFGSVLDGRLEMLARMCELNADLGSRSVTSSNLLYEAAHSGHPHIVDYLLVQLPRLLNVKVRYQDRPNLTHTPLHIAALVGHAEVVQRLLAAHADHSMSNETGRTALDDAVDRGQAPVVRTLVSGGADLFKWVRKADLPQGSPEFSAYMSSVEHLFRSDTATIAAAAEGLQDSSQQVELFTPQLFARFLETPGAAPGHMLRAAFRERTISYWHTEGERRKIVRKWHSSGISGNVN